MQIPVHSRFKKEHISRNLGHLKLSFAGGRGFNLGVGEESGGGGDGETVGEEGQEASAATALLDLMV